MLIMLIINSQEKKSSKQSSYLMGSYGLWFVKQGQFVFFEVADLTSKRVTLCIAKK